MPCTSPDLRLYRPLGLIFAPSVFPHSQSIFYYKHSIPFRIKRLHFVCKEEVISWSGGVNLRLYHHSADTHIYCSFKIAETFDLLGFSRQKADSFTMPGMAKLVDDSDFFQVVAGGSEDGDVAGKGCGIAAYID